MSRKVAVAWHASFSILAGVLYYLFVLPRWWELSGETSHTLGTVLRIVTGALIGLAALPVVFTLLRTRRPELGTPQMALSLRTSSIALHVLAGVLIVGTAISEIWLSLDSAGRWLFGIYGAAAAIALLGIFAFYLAFVAELPPPPPKPLKPKAEKSAVAAAVKRRRQRTTIPRVRGIVEETVDADSDEASPSDADDPAQDEPTRSHRFREAQADLSADPAVPKTPPTRVDTLKRPTVNFPKTSRRQGRTDLRRRRRLRGGVAVED